MIDFRSMLTLWEESISREQSATACIFRDFFSIQQSMEIALTNCLYTVYADILGLKLSLDN